MTFVEKDKTYLHNYRKSRISQMAIDFKSFEVFVTPKKTLSGPNHNFVRYFYCKTRLKFRIAV